MNSPSSFSSVIYSQSLSLQTQTALSLLHTSLRSIYLNAKCNYTIVNLYNKVISSGVLIYKFYMFMFMALFVIIVMLMLRF